MFQSRAGSSKRPIADSNTSRRADVEKTADWKLMSGGDHGISSEDRQRTAADPISTEVRRHEARYIYRESLFSKYAKQNIILN